MFILVFCRKPNQQSVDKSVAETKAPTTLTPGDVSRTVDQLVHTTLRRSSKNDRFQCQKCPKSFPVMKLYREHMNIHLGRRPFFERHRCPFCPLKLFSSSTYYKHVKERHADRLRATKTDTSTVESQSQNIQAQQHQLDMGKSSGEKRSRKPEPDLPHIQTAVSSSSVSIELQQTESTKRNLPVEQRASR